MKGALVLFIGLVICIGVVRATESEAIGLGGLSTNVYTPDDPIFLEESEGEVASVPMSVGDEAESVIAEGEEAEADVEADDEFTESDEEAAEDEDEFDLDADEEADAELDEEAQETLQAYAESEGAVEQALDSLSSEAALSDSEAAMNSELEAVPSNGKTVAKPKRHSILPTGLKMSQLNLRDEKGEGARINLAQGKGRYSMGVNAAGVFSVDMEGRTVLSVSGKSGMVRARGDVTVWNTLKAGSLTLNRVPQWKLVRQDTFEKFVPLPKRPVIDNPPPKPNRSKKSKNGNTDKPASPTVTTADVNHGPQTPDNKQTSSANTPQQIDAAKAKLEPLSATAANKALAKKARGWLYDDVIKCNGFSMLSAKPSRTISTSYKNLPKHTQIRITATVHFIDDWQGETAWLKLNNFYVWTESHDQKSVAGKFSMCGSDLYPESRFSAPIDVIWSHKSKSLQLSFGSNLDGSDARFAISNVAIHTRDTTRRKSKKQKKQNKKCLKKDPKNPKKCLEWECKGTKDPKTGKCVQTPKPAKK